LLYEGTWQGVSVKLTTTSARVASGHLTPIGTLSGFATNDPRFSCLVAEPVLEVYSLRTDPDHYYVITKTPNDCIDGSFTFDKAGPRAPVTTTTIPASTGPRATG
jgi:hypothetical protein